MAEKLKKLVAEKKNVVEAVMDVFEQGAEFVASIAGDFFPIFSIAGPIVCLALDNVESKEASFMTDQFQKVREHLEVASEQIQRINQEIEKSGVDAAYSSVEENITNQFRKYMHILTAKPEFREAKKKQFLDHFTRTGGEKNLNILHSAVTGTHLFTESVLEIMLNYEEKSRRAMEDFCARLNKLLCLGLIALMGFTTLKGCDEEEEAELISVWQEKMNEIQAKMNTVIEDCIVSFPTQAKQDSEKLVRDHPDLTNQELAKAIVDKLKKNYDWVHWSVRIFSSPSGWFTSSKNFHCSKGESLFQVPVSDEKPNVVVSYSDSPEPLDKACIQQLIQSLEKPKVVNVAELLSQELPGPCVVHTVKNLNDLVWASSFDAELHYWELHRKTYVCAHSS